ncbi:hypothetical protein Dimus_010732 [Dionaea muscipula]
MLHGFICLEVGQLITRVLKYYFNRTDHRDEDTSITDFHLKSVYMYCRTDHRDEDMSCFFTLMAFTRCIFEATTAGGEQRVDLDLPTAIDLGAGKEAAAKAQNGGERKCEAAAAANVIIISIETRNGRVVKERSRKKKTGGGPTFTSLLTVRSKEAAAISGIARKREDLIIVNIDEASGDDELAVAEYAEDIYKFYKLTRGESQVCDYMGKQPDIDERMRSILVDWLICRPTNIFTRL